MHIGAEIWDADRLERLETRRTHTAADKAPVYALYLFASLHRPIIRAGAIGANRSFDAAAGAFSDRGNSISQRFDQFNRAPPAGKASRSGAGKQSDAANLLPWNARPYRYIWGATLAGEVTPNILSVAENILRQRLCGSGLRYRGGSCLDCDHPLLAIEVAAQSLAVFLDLAPILFAAPDN